VSYIILLDLGTDIGNIEHTLSCPLECITERRGVGNPSTSAKDVREYFVKYFNDPIHALSWQNKVIRKS